ncbi:hypothetical protein D3C73_772100 [compost metagenome]
MGCEGVQIQHFVLIFQIIIVEFLELFRTLLLAAENTDDRHPLNRFIDNRIDLTETRADNRVVFGGDFAVEHDPENHNRHDEQTDQAEPDIQQEQGDVDACDIDNACAEIGQYGDEQIFYRFRIIRHPGHHLARRQIVKKVYRQPLDMRVHIGPQLADDLIGRGLQPIGFAELGKDRDDQE